MILGCLFFVTKLQWRLIFKLQRSSTIFLTHIYQHSFCRGYSIQFGFFRAREHLSTKVCHHTLVT